MSFKIWGGYDGKWQGSEKFWVSWELCHWVLFKEEKYEQTNGRRKFVTMDCLVLADSPWVEVILYWISHGNILVVGNPLNLYWVFENHKGVDVHNLFQNYNNTYGKSFSQWLQLVFLHFSYFITSRLNVYHTACWIVYFLLFVANEIVMPVKIFAEKCW